MESAAREAPCPAECPGRGPLVFHREDAMNIILRRAAAVIVSGVLAVRGRGGVEGARPWEARAAREEWVGHTLNLLIQAAFLLAQGWLRGRADAAGVVLPAGERRLLVGRRVRRCRRRR